MNNSGLRCSCSNNAGTNLADEKTFSIVKGEIRELIDVAWNHKRHTEADEILTHYLEEIMERFNPSEGRTNLLDLVMDLSENSHRNLCSCEQLQLVNLANFLIANKPTNKSAPAVECILKYLSKCELSERHQLDKVWKFVYQLETSPSQNLLLKIDPLYLEDLTGKVLEEDSVDIAYDESYIDLLNILLKSADSFQSFSSFMAERIANDNFVSPINQKILGRILTNIKQKLTKPAFYNLYEKSIKSFVILLDNLKGAKSETLEEKLKALKKDDRMKFYVLVTHYPELLYLVEE